MSLNSKTRTMNEVIR